MPWCETCEQQRSPSSLAPDGTCMTCGAFIASPDDEPADTGRTRAPWHFYLMMIALVTYLGWRLIQGVGWVVGRF